jgi:hypothetical protein
MTAPRQLGSHKHCPVIGTLIMIEQNYHAVLALHSGLRPQKHIARRLPKQNPGR